MNATPPEWQERPQQVAGIISDFLNTGSSRIEDLVKALLDIHPCLQQWFTHLCVRWLESLAYKQGDGRNSQAILLARQFVLGVPKKLRKFSARTTGPEGIGPFRHQDEG